MMMIGLLLCMFVSSSDIVVAASCLIGLGYGGLAGGILPTLTADLFGTQHFAKNYSILQPAYPIGEKQTKRRFVSSVFFLCFQDFLFGDKLVELSTIRRFREERLE
jgi:hypothetical protein